MKHPSSLTPEEQEKQTNRTEGRKHAWYFAIALAIGLLFSAVVWSAVIVACNQLLK